MLTPDTMNGPINVVAVTTINSADFEVLTCSMGFTSFESFFAEFESEGV
jgi:hypothetical protein